ncbi:MAG: polyprenyl synthetase family protein [Eubacteriales bacterium]
MTFKDKLKQKQTMINDVISRYLPQSSSYQKTILESISYSISSGGKRIRPILMEETYRLFGGNSNVIDPFLVAIEMIHTYSLVHDDLPSLDNDDYRRGRLTTHKKFGEDMAILTGDAMLNYSFEIMAQACVNNENEARELNKAMYFLAKKAGIYGMIGGQVVDVESENKDIPLEQLNFIHKHKTAALIEAAMVVGAIIAKAQDEEVQLISNIGQRIGLAFQIQDDILDITSSMQVLGKPINSDNKNKKSTYVQYYGLEKSKEHIKKLSYDATRKIKMINKNNTFLIELVNYLIYREK